MNKQNARTAPSHLRQRVAYRFWLLGRKDRNVMIADSASVEDAKQSLQATFGNHVTRVERIGED